MIVNYSNNLPKVQIKPIALNNKLAFGQTARLNKDTFTFGAAQEKQGEQLAVFSSIGKGIVKPVKDILSAVVKNPLATGLIVAATVAVIHFLPIMGTALALGVCAFGGYQILAGLFNGIKAVKAQKTAENKDYTKANNHFQNVGEGMFDVALTANAAVRGVKELRGTISAISEASKAAAAEGKTLTAAQKLYSVLKQVQTRAQVSSAPTKIEDVLQQIIQDGKNELLLLKDAGKIKQSTKDLKEIIEKIADPNKKAQLLKLLDDLSDVTKHSKRAEQISSAIKEILQAEKVTNTEVARLLEIVDATREQPAVLAVLKSALKTGTVDDAAKALNKIIGANRYSDDAIKTVVGVENINDTTE
ncbi:MAG: hypothetical protein AB1782_04980 [Cyanobacteriota bacterium]